MRKLGLVLVILTGLVAELRAEKMRIRVGHFPNVTHAQALVASQLQQQGKGWFQQRLGPDVEIQWFVYNAGPSAMEAIFANSIDLTYVGPNPVLNAYTKSQGEEIRVIAGAALGGAALVVHGEGGLRNPREFKGKRVATPQLGNTQDVAARAWAKRNGFRITQLGGDVLILPTANPDQLSLFQQKQVDAVWTVEPWVSRLELEAGGKILIEQKDAVTTVLASSARFLAEQPELARKFAVAHAELTKWINDNAPEAQGLMRAQLKELTKRDFPAELAARSWARLTFTSEISRPPFDALVTEAQSVGFLKGAIDLGRLVQPLK
jgi:NitT/TauT family transport system substrate-binding protein